MVKTGTKWIGMAAIGLGLIASTASYAQKAHWHLGAEAEVMHYNSDQKDKSGATATKKSLNNIFVKKAEVKLTGHLGDGFVLNIANDFMFSRAVAIDPKLTAASSVTAANITYSGLADGLTLKLGKYLTVPTAQFNSPVAYSWNDVGTDFNSVYSLLWREAVGLSYVNDGFSLHFDGGTRDIANNQGHYAEQIEGASKFSHVTRLGYMSDVMDDMAFAVAVNNMRENHNLSPAAANNGSVVSIIDASVAGTRLNAIDSTHNANAVVINPVYSIPPSARGDDMIGVKSGIRGAKAIPLFSMKGDNSKNKNEEIATIPTLIAETGKAACGLSFIISSSCRYPNPNPIG